MIASLLIGLVPTPPSAEHRSLIGERIALAEWRVAANRATCVPLALASDGSVPAKPRSASFTMGWGVAFDTPRRRSAYGFAGVGLLDADSAGDQEKRDALTKQWPYTRALSRGGGLPAGSLAGYGIQGGGRYSRANPRGRGEYSVAYVRIPGQSCLYNVWSRVSRAHLEKILDSLRFVPEHRR